MISDDEELSLRRGLAENPEQVWPQVIIKYTPIIRDHLRELTGEMNPIRFIEADQCEKEVMREARMLLRYTPPNKILDLKLSTWFCKQAEKKFKELFVEALIRLYQGELFSHLAKMLNDDIEGAKDCWQETLTSAWKSVIGKSAGEIQSLYGGNPRAWLYTIARTKAYDYSRRRGVLHMREEPTREEVGTERQAGGEADPGPRPTAIMSLGEEQADKLEQKRSANPEEAAEVEEIRREVRLALETLPGTFEKPVRMYYLDEKKYSEVAQELGMLERTARANVHYGLQKLRRYLIVKKKLEEERDVQEKVPALWDRHQSVVRLHFFEDLSLDQIAQQQHWTPNKTKQYLYRGIEDLWKFVERRGK